MPKSDFILKYLLLISGLLISIPNELKSQPFHGGLLAGVTASQVDGDALAGYNKVGLQGGVFVNMVIKGNWGAQFEIKYEAKGARKPTTTDDPNVYQLTLNYIDLPLMINYTIKNKLILELGLVPGYLFHASGKGNDGKISNDEIVKFKKFDLASLLGIRYKIFDKLSVGARYSYSILPIRTLDAYGGYYNWVGNLLGFNTGDYNNYLSFGVYYQFE